MGNFIIQNGIIVNEGRQFVGSLVVTNGIIAEIITEGNGIDAGKYSNYDIFMSVLT